jgi:hypothetical protein
MADKEYDAFERLSRFRRHNVVEGQEDEAAQMARNRRINQKRGSFTGAPTGGGANVSFATGRPRDPLFYWKQNNLYFDYDDNIQLARLREFCRLLYMTHPIIGSCVDIYTKYPVLGMELQCKDSKLEDFYGDLFFSEEGLDYENFFLDVGREYWSVGEVFPFGSFNEVLGIWESDELLNPDDVEVERSPFLKEPRFLIRLPHTIREILQSRSPVYEYEKLVGAYPELLRYANENELMPVSNILLRQLRFKAHTFAKRGIPLLMRAMRPAVQEEQLNSAMDAIADRLYVPFLLAKLGATASDLGTTQPWIPTDDDMAAFEEAVDTAMAADFRLLTYNFAVEMEPVFGREQMPDLTPDFERLEDRMLQTFGLSRTMLTGASSGQTYAADALNRDLVSQLLTTYQRMLESHYRQRAMVVAEAQEHYDYDVRNNKRYVKMEEILEIDEESGEERIVEQPKLLVPELKFKTLNLKDEEAQRQFLEQLREAGVPVSIKTRLQNVPIEFDDEVERSKEEQVKLAVAEQETRREQYLALRREGLPIDPGLLADFQPQANNMPQPADMASRTPVFGLDPILDMPNLAPTAEDLAVPPGGGTVQPGVGEMPVEPMGGDPMADESQVPEESNEMREGMPKPASLWRNAKRMRQVAAEHHVEPPRPEGEDQKDSHPRGAFAAPKHIGKRRYVEVDPDRPMDEE